MSHGKPQTLIEVLGKNRLVFEHHGGISCYTPEQIMVRTTYGYLTIKGKDMKLCCMSRQQLCIMGTIENLELIGGSENGPVE